MRTSKDMGRFAWQLLLWFAVSGFPAVAAPVAFHGNPPVTRFEPDLDVYPQNFATTQAANAIIHVANAEGVLSFDGERWRLVRLPNRDLVRALAESPDGRTYVGGFGLFGYLETDATGVEHYVDLTERFRTLLNGEDFADIWDVKITKQGIFFRAVKHVFLFEPQTGETRLWRHEGRFGGFAIDDDEVMLQFRGEGMRRYQDGEWQFMPGTESLSELVWEFVRLDGEGFITLQQNGRWQRLHEGRILPFEVPEGFPGSSDITCGVMLRDGTLAFVSDDGHAYFLDAHKQRYTDVTLSTGFLATVENAAVGDGVLITSDEAVFLIKWPSAWTYIGREQGLQGETHDIGIWGDDWYALTSSGAYRYRGIAGDEMFVDTGWTDHESWGLLPLDDRRALLADAYRLLLIEDNKVTDLPFGDIYPRTLQRSRFDEDIIFVGTEFGLLVLREQGRQISLLHHIRDESSPTVSTLAETAAGEIWLGTERNSIRRLRFSADYSSMLEDRMFDDTDGLEFDVIRQAGVSIIDERLVVSTNAGFFRFDDGRFIRDENFSTLDAMRDEAETLQLHQAPDGTAWANSYKHIYFRPPNASWHLARVQSFLRGAINKPGFDADSNAYFSASARILRFDSQVNLPLTKPSPVVLRRVSIIDDDGGAIPVPLDNEIIPEFDVGTNLRFEFSTTDTMSFGETLYQARMDAYEEGFPPFSTSSRYTLFKIDAGEHSFHVRAMDNRERISEMTPFVFRINPPWYAGTIAIVAWWALGIISVILLVMYYTRMRIGRLDSYRLQLEQMVTERTSALEDVNRRLEAMAHIDGLTEIANRRRLDAYLDTVWRHSVNRHRDISLLVIDVDHFKDFNDRFGHIAGDLLLKKLAGILSDSLRRTEDLAARFGGEEFMVVMPGAKIAAAVELAEHIRQRVEESSLGATISVGVASIRPSSHDTLARLIETADRALYQAKNDGRNLVREQHG